MVDLKCQLSLRLPPAVSKTLQPQPYSPRSPVPLHPIVSSKMLLALCATWSTCASQFQASSTPLVWPVIAKRLLLLGSPPEPHRIQAQCPGYSFLAWLSRVLEGGSVLSQCSLYAIPSTVCQMPEARVQGLGVIGSHLGLLDYCKESNRFMDLCLPRTPSQTTKLWLPDPHHGQTRAGQPLYRVSQVPLVLGDCLYLPARWGVQAGM